jgi:uncharacterized protein YlxW (UPF0749 family)
VISVTFHWQYVALAIALLLAAVIAVSLKVIPKRQAEKTRQEPILTGTVDELAKLREELEQLRQQVQKIQRKLEALPNGQPTTPYNKAVEMAHMGASADQIAASCGISRGEAELIVALNRNPRA